MIYIREYKHRIGTEYRCLDWTKWQTKQFSNRLFSNFPEALSAIIALPVKKAVNLHRVATALRVNVIVWEKQNLISGAFDWDNTLMANWILKHVFKHSVCLLSHVFVVLIRLSAFFIIKLIAISDLQSLARLVIQGKCWACHHHQTKYHFVHFYK